jgi:general stress protein 26
MREEHKALKDKIKDIKLAMLTTVEPDGELHTRPMATHEMEDDGTLWFFTYNNSAKAKEIQHDRQISLSYTDTSSETYVCATGTAAISQDIDKMEELWNPALKAWFPEGLDEPHIALLKVKLHRAEYWDEPGGKLVSLFRMAKAIAKGEKHDAHYHEKLKLD